MTESRHWRSFPFLQALRPEPGEVVDAAVLATYSADLVVVAASLLALAGLDDDRGSGSKVDFANAFERLNGRCAGSRNLIHMHGELFKARCVACDRVQEWREDIEITTKSPCCGATGKLRPHVVWFGEMPLQMERIAAMLSICDLFVSIGTSGTVYPAAGFVQEARLAGARTVELNLEPSDGRSLFVERQYGPATQIVPAFVERLLAGA